MTVSLSAWRVDRGAIRVRIYLTTSVSDEHGRPQGIGLTVASQAEDLAGLKSF